MNAEINQRIEDKMIQLMEYTLDALLERAKSGDITSAEAAVCARMLKDNDVTIGVTEAEIDEGVKDALADAVGNATVIPLPFAKEA